MVVRWMGSGLVAVLLAAALPGPAVAARDLPPVTKASAKALTVRALKKRFTSYRTGTKRKVTCAKAAPFQCDVGWRKGSNFYYGFGVVSIVSGKFDPKLGAFNALYQVALQIGISPASCVKQSHSVEACVIKSSRPFVLFDH